MRAENLKKFVILSLSLVVFSTYAWAPSAQAQAQRSNAPKFNLIKEALNNPIDTRTKVKVTDTATGESVEAVVERNDSELRQVHPRKLREDFKIWLAQSRTLGAYKEATKHFPVEALQFYSVVGAYALADAINNTEFTPDAFNDFLTSLEHPVTYFSFYCFVLASRTVGLIGSVPLNAYTQRLAMRNALSNPGVMKMLGVQAYQYLLGNMGLAAGSFVSGLVEGIVRSPDTKTVTSMMFRKRTANEEAIFDRSLDNLAQQWLTAKGLSTHIPTVINLTLASTASAGTKMLFNTLKEASKKTGVTPVLKTLGMRIPMGRGIFSAGRVLMNSNWVTGMVSLAIFIGWDHLLSPIVNKNLDEVRLTASARQTEAVLLNKFSMALTGSEIPNEARETLKDFLFIREGRINLSIIPKWIEYYFRSNKQPGVQNNSPYTKTYFSKYNSRDLRGSIPAPKAQNIAEQIMHDLELYNAKQKEWRSHSLTKMHMAHEAWQKKMDAVNVQGATTMDFYMNFVAALSSDRLNTKNTELVNSALNMMNSGAADWVKGFSSDPQYAKNVIEAKRYGITVEVIEATTPSALSWYVQVLKNRPKSLGKHLAHAINLKIDFNQLAQASEDDVIKLINEVESKNTTVSESGYYIIPPSLQTYNSFPHSPYFSVLSGNTTNLLVGGMACGTDVDAANPLIVNIPAIGQPSFIAPRIVNEELSDCRRSRAVSDEVIVYKGNTQTKYNNLLDYIANNLSTSVRTAMQAAALKVQRVSAKNTDNSEESQQALENFENANRQAFYDMWWKPKVAPGLNKAITDWSNTALFVTRQVLGEMWGTKEVVDTRRAWAPGYFEKGGTFAKLWEKVSRPAVAIEPDNRVKTDDDLVSLPNPSGIHPSLIAEAEKYARMAILIFPKNPKSMAAPDIKARSLVTGEVIVSPFQEFGSILDDVMTLIKIRPSQFKIHQHPKFKKYFESFKLYITAEYPAQLPGLLEAEQSQRKVYEMILKQKINDLEFVFQDAAMAGLPPRPLDIKLIETEVKTQNPNPLALPENEWAVIVFNRLAQNLTSVMVELTSYDDLLSMQYQ